MIFFAFNSVSENTCITGVLPEKILSLKKNALNTLYVKFNRLIQLSKKKGKNIVKISNAISITLSYFPDRWTSKTILCS